MMEYRRVISYLYEYHGRSQGKNVGFVRLEVRNGQCRLRIFLKGDVEGQKVGRAEMFRCGREPGQIFLGTMPVRASGAEGAFLTQAQNIAGSGLPLGEFCGIGVFPDGSGKKYFSFWDERRPWDEVENNKNADAKALEQRREPEQPPAAEENEENPVEGQTEPAVLEQRQAGEPVGSVEQERESGQRMEPRQEAEGTHGEEHVAEQENSRRESSLSQETEGKETPMEGTPERSRQQEEEREAEEMPPQISPDSAARPETPGTAESPLPEQMSSRSMIPPEGTETSETSEQDRASRTEEPEQEYRQRESSPEIAPGMDEAEPGQSRLVPEPNNPAENPEPLERQNPTAPEQRVRAEKPEWTDLPNGMNPEQSQETQNASPEQMRETQNVSPEQRQGMQNAAPEQAEPSGSRRPREMQPVRVDQEVLPSAGEQRKRPAEPVENLENAENPVSPSAAGGTGQEAVADVSAQSMEPDLTWSVEPRITWNQIWNTYPKYQPFGPEDPWEVLRISIQDIGRLPREYWHLGGNDFLLNGYYAHRHLILAKDIQEDLYFIGVPGDSMNQDYRVAEMFGFRQYRPAEKLGYWLFRIKL